MVYLGLLVILLIMLFDFYRYRNLFSPTFLFCGLFFFILTLALLKLNGIGEFTNKSVFTIEIGVLFFSLGCLFLEITFSLTHKQRYSKKASTNDFSVSVNWFWIYVALFLASIGVITTSVVVSKVLISGGDYNSVRASLLGYDQNTPLIKSQLLNGVVRYISTPGLYALIPFAIFFLLQKKHIIFSSVVFLEIAINVFSTGGRIILVYTIFQFLATFFYFKVSISKKTKRRLILLIVLGFVSIMVISNTRSSKSLFEVAYAYFSGPVVLLSDWQKIVDTSGFMSKGLSFFYPFTYMANMISDFLGVNIDVLKSTIQWQSAPQDVWLKVFPNMSMNAFSTLFYFFYLDFRQLGVMLFSFLYGVICNKYYYKAYKMRDSNSFIIYLMIIRSLIGSFIIWQLGSTTFFVSYLMVLLCLKTNKKGIENDS